MKSIATLLTLCCLIARPAPIMALSTEPGSNPSHTLEASVARQNTDTDRSFGSDTDPRPNRKTNSGSNSGSSQNSDGPLNSDDSRNSRSSQNSAASPDSDRSLNSDGSLNSDDSRNSGNSQNSDGASDSGRSLNSDGASDSASPLNSDGASDSASPLNSDGASDSGSAQNSDGPLNSDDSRNSRSSQNSDASPDSDRPLNSDASLNSDDSRNSGNSQNSDEASDSRSPLNSDEASDSRSPLNSDGASDSASPLNSDGVSDSRSSQIPGDALKLETPSAILIEASTGTVIYEKDPHKKLRPASITKIMTLLLIFEALEKGNISLADTVTVSAHAASMGGSQVFLEEGEQQTVQDLIKCISIASANDACVAMAEYIGGSEEAFVAMMNERAGQLGMTDTTFANSCGLEAEGHLTSAKDISLMARELSLYHPEIFDYCTVWMDTITHRTSKGEKEFGLTNTNKLIRYYSYATGLKTGYTSQSKYCLAATASKEDVDLIAVVMAEKTPALRTKEAISLLDYGFSRCRIYSDTDSLSLPSIPVRNGSADEAALNIPDQFSYVILDGSAADTIKRHIELPEELTAPIQAGDEVGSVVYCKDGHEIGRIAVTAAEDVEARSFSDCMKRNWKQFLLDVPAPAS